MVRKTICFTTVIAALLILSCGGNSRQSKQIKETSTFSLPAIPSMITHPAERADYLAGHYWDNLDFNDTSLIHKPEILEQAFVNFIDIFPHVTEGTLKQSIHKTLERALINESMFSHFTDLFEKYLYDPNAPMRNEECYAFVVDYIIESEEIDDINKVRPLFQLEQIKKNRRGTIAIDFVYTLSNGRQESMHRIKADYTILFFNNPGCIACGEYQQGLELAPVVTQLMGAGRLKILAMYVDEDIASWEGYRASIPSSWINGYDAPVAIRNGNLYDLRAIPSLYLLDKEKRVLLKDALPNQIEEMLIYYVQNGL